MIRHFSIAISLNCLFAIGCGTNLFENSTLPDVGGPSGVVTWSENTPAKSNCDQGTVYHLGKLFVLWSDSPNGGGGSTSSNRHGVSCTGEMVSLKGDVLTFACESSDGKTGTAIIAGQSFDLEKGRLFLVKAEGDAWRIRQLNRNFGQFEIDKESLCDLAERDDEINDFFTEARSDNK